ncbi:MAG: endonuclease MutS2, partial [Dialister sp.]|nr:endonuclease MutS2 [Dialister sp.]
MNQEIFQILEFDEIKKMLEKLAPSSLAKKKAMNLCPSDNPEKVSEWLLQTEEANICLEKEITTPLGETYDIFQILKKADKDIILLPKEFMELASSLETYDKMYHYFEGERHLLYPLLEAISQNITPENQLIRNIRQVFDEKGEIRDHASVGLAKIRNDMEYGRAKIRKAFQKILNDKNQSSYFQDFIITQRNHRYVVPIKEEYRHRFDGIVHDRSATGQTLFMEPMISVQLNNDLAELLAAERQEIHAILEKLTNQVKQNKDILEKNCNIATEIEFI